MITKLQSKKAKQEGLIDLAKQAGLDTRVYPHPIVGYEPITFEAWIREMNVNLRVKEWIRDYSLCRIEEALKRPQKKGFFHPSIKEPTEDEKKRIKEKIIKDKCQEIERKIGQYYQIYASRYYLSGNGLKQNLWTLPLSRGVLLTLLEAQETQQFCRFEIWEPHKVVDPILTGFSSWHPKWEIESCEYTRDGRPDGDHFLRQCRVTYKICAWE